MKCIKFDIEDFGKTVECSVSFSVPDDDCLNGNDMLTVVIAASEILSRNIACKCDKCVNVARICHEISQLQGPSHDQFVGHA